MISDAQDTIVLPSAGREKSSRSTFIVTGVALAVQPLASVTERLTEKLALHSENVGVAVLLYEVSVVVTEVSPSVIRASAVQ